ncbi:MAG: hypothetical protein JWR21_4116 [Herminiimonas sp.]|nr:hypothetical protein [Herminiimonas sp.]MDB5853746.1 hypothetical protein [Herminiimonas sp.]
MSAAYAPSHDVSYLNNIVQAVQNLFSAVFVLKARDYVECFESALAMNRVIGGRANLTPDQLEKLRVMAGVSTMR